MLKQIKEISIDSFGFKYYDLDELPDYDLRIDLRNKMKNPQSHLPKGATGKDRNVINTILESDQNKKVVARIEDRIKLKIKSSSPDGIFKIGFGCRSGIHRSVVLADYFTELLSKKGYVVNVNHIHLKLR